MDLAPNGAHAIVGRHDQCDVMLRTGLELSLRHLIVTVVPLADAPALRILDLHTSVPFFLDDDVPRRSVVSCDLYLYASAVVSWGVYPSMRVRSREHTAST